MPPAELSPLEKKKEELYAALKGVSARLRHKRHEEATLRDELSAKMAETGLNARELRKRKARLEFRISTEATSLAKERAMMKEMKLLDKELAQASELERMERKLWLVEGDIRAAESEIIRMKGEIDSIKKEIRESRESERDKIREEREKEWQERKRSQLMTRKAEREKEMKKELEPYMGGVDEGGVELGSIAIIKKKE
jgi:chromosome segregation ATPase